MIFGKKIKAGALQFVLFIGAVIAILLMAFMLLSNTHSLFAKQTDVLVSVVKSANYGIERSLKGRIPLGTTVEIQNESDPTVQINVKREFWGIFEKRIVLAKRGKLKQTKVALTGAQDRDGMPAIFLRDKQRPLILAGSSSVSGTAFLPRQGVKPGYINGRSYGSANLIYGRRKTSDSLLPTLSLELEDQIKQLTETDFIPDGTVMGSIPNKGMRISFEAPTIIFRERVARLRDVNLVGNIVISASHKIIVEADAHLQDVILLAPEIVIENWVKGNFQAIASESIRVGKKCELAYPTALVVAKKKTVKDGNEPITPSIYMDQYAEVRGTVMTLDSNEEQEYNPQIMIEEHAKVTGEVYCSKNLELRGRVNGNVTTDSFITLENGSVYQNHLYNGIINGNNISESYAGLLLAHREGSKKVMQWLY